MPGRASAISTHLRERKRAIAEVWESLVRTELRALDDLDRSALIDHLPEFLDGLADWVDGDTKSARCAFGALIEGHAAQRLAYGIELATLTREYALLRSTIIRELLSIGSSESTRETMARLNEGLDEAIYQAVRRYMHGRDLIRDRFIAMLAHDLRNPLGAISMASERVMAANGESPATLHRLGATIHRSAQRMARMIGDMVEFARVQLGGDIPIALQPGDLGDIAREALDELRVSHPDRTLQLELSGDLHGYYDPDRTLQLVSNLISNAIEHGSDPITVSVTEHADHRALELAVHNRGPVIPAERISKLFDPFHLETARTRRGLGLGLFIVRQIALGHGARCEVRSTEADGTTFTVMWPRTPASEVPNR